MSNTDDHLRNHGFLLGAKGWILSPAYDLNPVPESSGLTLNISEYSNLADLDLAREVAEKFRVSASRSKDIIKKMIKAVGVWRDVAMKAGMTRVEIGRVETAFRV